MSMPVLIEEAKANEKICPFTFGSPDRGNIQSILSPPFPCLGARCMAWRFGRTHIKDDAGDLTVICDDKFGYCGLAGVPGQAR